MEEFLRKQEEIIERFDSGFDGYRGLNGESIERDNITLGTGFPLT